jgi:hypothetical protein
MSRDEVPWPWLVPIVVATITGLIALLIHGCGG